jgi:ribonuclease Z
MIRLTFLGTSAAAPTVARNVSGLACRYAASGHEGRLMLFDCGEGSQRQMMKYGTGFDVMDVFFTHLHADHYLGIIGFVRTLWMADRKEPMHLYGPRPAGKVLASALALGLHGARFPVEVHELRDGDVVSRDGYEIKAFNVDHRISAMGFALVEPDRPGRFDLSKAEALGIPSGPLYGKLQRGEAVTLAGGRSIDPREVVGAPRCGRKLVISGDTRPCSAVREAARGADLLVHEGTFGDEEMDRALETSHSTAREAARIAREASVRRLILTHLSSRYDQDVGPLLRQAREEYPRVEVARDGMQVEIPYADEGPAPGDEPSP